MIPTNTYADSLIERAIHEDAFPAITGQPYRNEATEYAMIPNPSPIVAQYQIGEGPTRQYIEKPVVSWQDGRAMVAPENGGAFLVPADKIAGFAGLSEPMELPIIAAVPADGWRYQVRDEDGTVATYPVAALLVHGDGDTEAITLDGEGISTKVHQYANFVALLAPGEDETETETTLKAVV